MSYLSVFAPGRRMLYGNCPVLKSWLKKHPGIKLRTEWRAARKQTAAGGNGREHPCGAGVPRPRAAASPGWAAGHESMGTW